jgi:hypothetical protein
MKCQGTQPTLSQIHFPALRSLYVGGICGHFAPHLPQLENLHLGLGYIELQWLRKLITQSALLERLSFTPSRVSELFLVIGSATQVHTMQIGGEVSHKSEEITHGVMAGLSHSKVLPTLRCLDLTYLVNVKGISGYVDDAGISGYVDDVIRARQPRLHGFVYRLHDKPGDLHFPLKCTNAEKDCCEALRQAFNRPEYAS